MLQTKLQKENRNLLNFLEKREWYMEQKYFYIFSFVQNFAQKKDW